MYVIWTPGELVSIGFFRLQLFTFSYDTLCPYFALFRPWTSIIASLCISLPIPAPHLQNIRRSCAYICNTNARWACITSINPSEVIDIQVLCCSNGCMSTRMCAQTANQLTMSNWLVMGYSMTLMSLRKKGIGQWYPVCKSNMLRLWFGWLCEHQNVRTNSKSAHHVKLTCYGV